MKCRWSGASVTMQEMWRGKATCRLCGREVPTTDRGVTQDHEDTNEQETRPQAERL